MANGDMHVTWREDEAKWAMEKQGASRASSLHDQKDAAEKAGRQNAINEHSEPLLHGKDGKIPGTKHLQARSVSSARLGAGQSNAVALTPEPASRGKGIAVLRIMATLVYAHAHVEEPRPSETRRPVNTAERRHALREIERLRRSVARSRVEFRLPLEEKHRSEPQPRTTASASPSTSESPH
jgi:Uncharacterized protein conserved in bacteria (DUF2188)